MHIVRRFLVTALVPALIVSIFAVGAAAAHGSGGKLTMCHWASNKFVKISVAMSAKPAHLKHGDVDPDEYGDCSGGHHGGHEGNHGGHDGDNDSHKCQGARSKSSHVRHDGGWSGKGGGNQRASSHGDRD